MAQYLPAIHDAGDLPDVPDAVWRPSFADVDAFPFADCLRTVDSAAVVRHPAGGFLLASGPRAVTREYRAGFRIISAPGLDAPLARARMAAVACRLPIEVRPFGEDDPAEITARELGAVASGVPPGGTPE
jgi:hypothetical protein